MTNVSVMHETNRQSQVSRAVGGRGGKTDGWRLRAIGCVDEWLYLRGRHAGAADLAPVLPRVHERHGAVKVAYGAWAAGGAALGSLRGRLATVCAVVRHQARHPVSPMKDASSRSVAAAELQWIGLQSSRSSARASVFGHARPCVSSRPAMVFAMASVCSIAGTSRVAGHTRGVPRVTAATSGGRPVAFPARTSRAHSATRVAVPRGCAVPLGLAMTQLPRGSLLAARARKGKIAVPEPVVEDEDDEDDEADAFDRDADADADDADADDADFLTEDEQTADDTEFAEVEETRDARELLPKSTKGIKKKTQVQVMEDDVGALRTAVGYVQSAVQNPAVRNGGILVGCVLAGSFSLSAYNVYMRYNSNKSKRKRQVNKNVVVVERLRDFFPQNR